MRLLFSVQFTQVNKEFDSAYKTLPETLGVCVEPVLVISYTNCVFMVI